jgi:agmatinase
VTSPRYQPASSLESPRFSGPPTFARLPLARTLEDVDFAAVGVPFDTATSYRTGGRFGPNAIRAASVMLRAHNPSLRVSPFEILSCVDYGDVFIVPGEIERSYAAITATLQPLISAGIVPLLLGGDHSCTLGHLRSLAGHTPVAIVDFDAHTDAWDSFFGLKYNHGTWVRRGLEEGLIDAAHSIEVGLRGPVHGPDDWTSLKTELGLDYLTTEEVLAIGATATAERIRRRLDGRPAFLTFDIDVVDPAYAPGTGTPEAGGLTSHDALSVLRGLAGVRFVGFDIMEVIPAYDSGGVTATLAANLGYEMLSLAAVSRSGRPEASPAG